MFFTRSLTFIIFLVLALFIFTQMVLPAFVPNLRFFWIFRKEYRTINKLDNIKTEVKTWKKAEEMKQEIDEITLDDVLKPKKKRK